MIQEDNALDFNFSDRLLVFQNLWFIAQFANMHQEFQASKDKILKDS